MYHHRTPNTSGLCQHSFLLLLLLSVEILLSHPDSTKIMRVLFTFSRDQIDYNRSLQVSNTSHTLITRQKNGKPKKLKYRHLKVFVFGMSFLYYK